MGSNNPLGMGDRHAHTLGTTIHSIVQTGRPMSTQFSSSAFGTSGTKGEMHPSPDPAVPIFQGLY